jgi:hypothetical protein
MAVLKKIDTPIPLRRKSSYFKERWRKTLKFKP